MPGTTSESNKDELQQGRIGTDPLDKSSENWNSKQIDSAQDWSPPPETNTDTMKSNTSQKSVESSSVLSKSSTSTMESPSVEIATEAKEKEHSKRSWMKNIGNGMRTLRLRKSSTNIDKSSSNKDSSSSSPIGKGIKMRIMDDEDQKSNSNSNSKEDEPSNSIPVSPSPPLVKSLNSAPPNVIPPFENDPPYDSNTINSNSSRKSNKSKKDKKLKKEEKNNISSNNTGTTSSAPGSMKRDHLKKWRKIGSGSHNSSTVNGNSNNSSSVTGNGTVPSSSSQQKPNNAGATGDTTETPNKADPSRFIGEGLSFKAKLIGVLEVSGPRGDRICQEALSELKMAVKAAGEHKQKVTVHVALDGLRIRDEKTGDCLYHHQVHKISFIAQDLTDSRAFGYIFGSPDTGHRFFGIKTEKSASQVVMAMRDLFQVVFDLKKKEIERAKQQLEMQQKFLATRAAESAPRTENKAGRIAETYIEGACALTPSSPRTSSAPAEADLLNLEVELSSLQQGLDNIHSNLMESQHHQNVPFNRGSTTSISSDPMNPKNTTSFKYSTPLISSSHQYNHNTNRLTSTSSTGGILDPFGDSFDPFVEGNKFIPSDPFSQVDPFPLPKPGLLESGQESFGPDPFNSPPAATNFKFSFSDTHGNTTISSTLPSSLAHVHNYSKLSESSNGPKMESGSASLDSTTKTVFVEKQPLGWTASFEDDFVPDISQFQKNSELPNGPSSLKDSSIDGSGVNLDIFTELDPLGTGKARPFIDRKDFFQELKNPPKKNLKDLCGSSIESPTLPSNTSMTISNASTTSALPSSQPQKVELGPIPNSFSSNFNLSLQNHSNTGAVDFDSHFKMPNNQTESKTSSIRPRLPLSSGLGNDSPPNYSPPPPPPTGTSHASNSVYFVSPQTTSSSTLGSLARSGGGSNINKSPQLLKRKLVIKRKSSISEINTNDPNIISTSSGRQFTMDSSGTDEIPNLTPPPRPPHSATLNRNTIATAVPRPHSGKNEMSRQTSIQTAPEPPPRPLQTTITTISSSSNLPLVSPPPLPPKKQSTMPTFSSTSAGKLIYNSTQGKHNLTSRISETGSIGSNDLPLPLPERKKNGNENSNFASISFPRYAVPPSFDIGGASGSRKIISSGSPHASRKQLESNITTQSLSSLNTHLTMEQALRQVATLSLGQLASKLDLPVEQLSLLTIQQLAERLTTMDIHDNNVSRKTSTTSSGFETNFDPEVDADVSMVSAPSTMEGAAKREQHKAAAGPTNNYDKYAVFRELTAEEASGFSIGENSFKGMENNKEESGSGSRTLTSRDSSSERTLQADEEPDNPMATMDDVTDVNFSDGEDKSILDDEIVDNYLDDMNDRLPEWATFESNFADQCIPLQETGFSKSEESPSWESDEMGSNPIHAFPISTDQRPKKLKTTKIESHASQFDFQPFKKPNSRLEDAIAIEEGESHLDPLVESSFQRQSSGSSKHSDRCMEKGSDYSGGSTGRENRLERIGSGSGRRLELPPDAREVVRKRESRTSSYSSSGRKYSRGESDELDEDYHHHRHHHRRQYDTTPSRHHHHREDRRRHYYVDDEEGGVENPSFDPTAFPHSPSTEDSARGLPRTRKHVRDEVEADAELENDIDEDDDKSYGSRHSYNPSLSPGNTRRHHHRRRHPPKYYQTHSQSLHRRGRDDHYSSTGRRGRDYSPERYSNHESDFDDSYEEENTSMARRGGGRDRDYYLREPDHSSRPSSSGSGRRNYSSGYHHYRGGSRDYYYREPRHGSRHHYNTKERRPYHGYEPEDIEHDELSDYSGEESERHRRRGRRPGPPSSRTQHHRRERPPTEGERYSNSASWDSESPPPHSELEARGERRRHSAGKGGVRPSSASLYFPDPPLSDRPAYNRSSSAKTRGQLQYQSELSLNKKSNNNKLSTNEFDELEAFSTQQQQSQPSFAIHPRQRSDPVPSLSSVKDDRTERTPKTPNSRKVSASDEQSQQPAFVFEDNFVAPSSMEIPEKYENVINQPESSMSVETPQDTSNTSGQTSGGQDVVENEVFFPSNFDVEKEVSTSTTIAALDNTIQELNEEEEENDDEEEIKTPDFIEKNSAVESKILTMISEESHNSTNSNSNNTCNNISDGVGGISKEVSGGATSADANEIEMKKSDSFSIFEREKDPFADDDFFK